MYIRFEIYIISTIEPKSNEEIYVKFWKLVQFPALASIIWTVTAVRRYIVANKFPRNGQKLHGGNLLTANHNDRRAPSRSAHAFQGD